MSKERFKCYYCAGIENILVEDTINNETYIEDNIVNLLNQQDKQIKELEQQLNKDFTLREYIRLEQENQQLKQQLHDLPKKIVCEISEAIERLSWRKRIYTNWEFDKEQLYKDLDTILKKYEGENEKK